MSLLCLYLLFLVRLSYDIAVTASRIEPLTFPGSDLSVSVTRPDIRAPKFEISHAEPELISPGYWFVAPYADLDPASTKDAFVPFQELVWSGAEFCQNRNVFDFRLQTVNGRPALTFIVGSSRVKDEVYKSAGMILDTSYQLVNQVDLEGDSYRWNLHEFKIIGGNVSINTIEKAVATDISSLGLTARTGLIWQHGFKETNINTGEVVKEWFPLEAGISITESMVDPPSEWSIHKEVSTKIWDCFHTNSVDKNVKGDYLVSMRYTSTIYKVSGQDSSIIWRLGGKKSDFRQDFNFSSQHHATFLSTNDSVTMISLLDNASDELDRQPSTARTSSIKIVALYEHASPKRAELLKQFDRPDGGLTKLRGSAQRLPNGGFFAGWSEDGYVSEFTSEGQSVLEAKFVGSRFKTYRAYKFDFVGTPSEPPILRSIAHGDGSGTLSNMSTVFFVSWNGATEVRYWDFYATNNISIPFEKVGTVLRSKFETSFMTKDFWAFAYAKARDNEGRSLGRSEVVMVESSNGLPQKYDNFSLAFEAGSLQNRPQSHAGVTFQISVAMFWVCAIAGICIIMLALVGLQMTLKTLCTKLTHLCVGTDAHHYSEVVSEQNEGLLGTLKNLNVHDDSHHHVPRNNDEDDGVS
ncbi:hypothetical protein H2200_006525 [Cladophialophora chaetospira]|uniref:ASST-domain-containing protein n=1 Tax=Cladophialophora chaetospira TaxID=386627 RepID=A0AA38X8Y9_9EURO|nr:hypothetical protein H2200_006525 [Cladophialophora chaetospira]